MSKNIQDEIDAETKRLVDTGTPAFLASIKAAGIVFKKHNPTGRESTDAELKAAMATSCIEP